MKQLMIELENVLHGFTDETILMMFLENVLHGFTDVVIDKFSWHILYQNQ